jgi:hypothetical protein
VHVQLLVGIEEKFELVFPRPDWTFVNVGQIKWCYRAAVSKK